MGFIRFLMALLHLHPDGSGGSDPNGAVFQRLVAGGSQGDPNG